MSVFRKLNNVKIHYSDRGTGIPIVLLHGYLESIEIWGEFARELSKEYRVICIDIPGHGKSEALGSQHSIIQLANIISSFLEELGITKSFMIGHSMGGYITLMFKKLYPQKLIAFSLFHSHPFADTKETKKKRIREIQFVNDGKKDLIARYNIPNAFANDNRIRLKKEIETSIEIALKTNQKGIVANIYAMMNRPDLSVELKECKIPFILIAGKKDNYINYNSIIRTIKLPNKSNFCVLEKSGHMGFIEEKEQALIIINQFINTL